MKLLAENLIRFKAKNLSDSQKNRLLSEQQTIGNTTVTKQIKNKNGRVFFFAPQPVDNPIRYDLIVLSDDIDYTDIDLSNSNINLIGDVLQIPMLEDLGFDYTRNKALGRKKLDDTDSLIPNADAQYAHYLLTNVIGISSNMPNPTLDDIERGYPVLYVGKQGNELIPFWGMMTVRKDHIDMHPGVKRPADPHDDDSELEDEPETPETIAITGRRGVIQIDQYLPTKDKKIGWFLHVFPPANAERFPIVNVES